MCIRDRLLAAAARLGPVPDVDHRRRAVHFHHLQHAAAGAHVVLLLLPAGGAAAVSFTHLRAHATVLALVCRLLLEKKKNTVAHIDTLL